MQNIMSIEEVLAEFRKKYGDSESDKSNVGRVANLGDGQFSTLSVTADASEPFKNSDTPNENPMRKSKRNNFTFPKIVVVQAITAAIILAVVVAAKLFNLQVYEYIVRFLQAKL